MEKIEDREKLRLLLPHWIEHNTEHAAEFREWAEKAGFARADLLSAAEQVEGATRALEAALRHLE